MSAEIVPFRPGLENVEAAKSAISEIDGKRAVLEYRGIAAETLAKESCYEETAWLLLKGELPKQRQLAEFDRELRQKRAIHFKLKDMLKCLPGTATRWTFCKPASRRSVRSTHCET